MSDTKFYPAPWSVIDKVGYAEIKSYNDDVCSLYGMCSTTKGESITCEDTMANAHLISASPDMYDALEAFERAVDLWLPAKVSREHASEAKALHRLRDISIEALKKARGES